MDTTTETVSVNNLLKQTGTIYRIILHLPFTVSASSLYLHLLNTEGLVPKIRATINMLSKENEHTPALQAIMIDTRR